MCIRDSLVGHQHTGEDRHGAEHGLHGRTVGDAVVDDAGDDAEEDTLERRVRQDQRGRGLALEGLHQRQHHADQGGTDADAVGPADVGVVHRQQRPGERGRHDEQAERACRAHDDVVERHPAGGDRGLRRGAVLQVLLRVGVLGVRVARRLRVRVGLRGDSGTPGLRRGVEARVAVVAAEPPSREDRVSAPHFTPPWPHGAALAQE